MDIITLSSSKLEKLQCVEIRFRSTTIDQQFRGITGITTKDELIRNIVTMIQPSVHTRQRLRVRSTP